VSNRKCLILRSSNYYGSIFNRVVCIDIKNQEEIFDLLATKKDKFWQIVERILTNKNIYYDHYKKEKINRKCEDITAMKFLDPDNSRVYCKEVKNTTGTTFIICAYALNKRVQKNGKKINAKLNKIAEYEYEIVKGD
jgi:hypothetical protein